jgi:hypothetical protein
MQVRVLNEEGLAEYRAFLSALRVKPTLDAPFHLLSDGNFSEPFEIEVEVEQIGFDTPFALGSYLVEKLASCEDRLISRNSGLWNWLALLYFDSICKKTNTGVRKVLEDAVYLLDSGFSFRKYYRHAARTPWLSVKEHGVYSKVLLLTAGRGIRSDISEQLGAHQDIFSNPTIIQVAYRLYFDEGANKIKHGLGKKGGSPRRLASLVRQLELTYDLRDCAVIRFNELLPKEFDRWHI